MKLIFTLIFSSIMIPSYSQLEKYDWEKDRSQFIPDSLHQYTLIVEDYSYQDFLEIRKTECFTPKDDKISQKVFAKYEKDKYKGLESYNYPYVYNYRDAYDTLPIEKYRFVLKSTLKILTPIEYLPDGECNGWVASNGYYIFDRRLNKVFPVIALMKLKKRNIGEAMN